MVAAYPDTIGLGTDEDNGLEISPRAPPGDGPRRGCVVDGHGAEAAPTTARHGHALSVAGLALHLLADGDRYDLRAQRVRRG